MHAKKTIKNPNTLYIIRHEKKSYSIFSRGLVPQQNDDQWEKTHCTNKKIIKTKIAKNKQEKKIDFKCKTKKIE